MIIKLNRDQMDYLNDNLFENREDLILKLKINKVGNCFWIELDNVTSNEIRDWANLQLQYRGFDANYELTEEGEILDKLIDTLLE
ncbi:hypothetical protein H8744_04645 [Oscillospiraceae bacterium N12]|jgi:hypothetical protein|uniref:Uncharacterized protein n=1 Tax=Jilunia laotingensis TaxID=2763675 RepID=A0A926INS3_9BACT|nr:hypothetical protein [Jilunia laotingensis]MBC8592544.1 hypothetical protein [Jilunia laotingensis]